MSVETESVLSSAQEMATNLPSALGSDLPANSDLPIELRNNTVSRQTPLMQQYYSIKAKYPETVLFFRMGDFFETFGEDAVITARVTGIVLTKRGSGSASEIELAGFPHHQIDNYLPKMIRAGYRVAVCEQLEDPKLAKGIVKRDVVEVVTPGVQTSERMLERNSNTYLGAVVIANGIAGLAFSDVSTGEFAVGEFAEKELADQLEALGIKELIVARKDASRFELSTHYIALKQKPSITKREDWIFHQETARQLLLEHFHTVSLKGFGIEEMTVGITAAGAVLDYLRETRSSTGLKHLLRISRYDTQNYLALDSTTRSNLEVFQSLHSDSRDTSLLGIMDQTSAPMGARLLRRWLVRPLRDSEKIESRFEAIEKFCSHKELRDKLRMELSELGDLERLLGRFASARVLLARDFLSLKFALWHLPEVKTCLESIVEKDEVPSTILRRISEELVSLGELAEDIDRTVHPDPPLGMALLGFIRDGASSELDELRVLTSNSRQKLLEIQTRERDRTGIGSLKVDFNNVFGYYIEISKVHQAKVPPEYLRRQTMTNAERYITPELKEYESKILGAEERMQTIEREMLMQLRARILHHIAALQKNSDLIAHADVLATFSFLASRSQWIRPSFNTTGELKIIDGRHPVVEKLLPIGERFVPNSVHFIPSVQEFFVITGPNMAGKSVFLRQTGIIALLAHIGSFVPAKEATLPLLDRIFTRVGASDNVANGESTFLVEMNEAANIINNASKRSLLLFDELGRGTSTFDGISIAWSIAEHIHDAIPGAKTLFATHYHELNELAQRHPRIHNLKVEVREADGKIHFLHKIMEGSADHSYGIEVAAMAGIPRDIIFRAREILRSLEETELRIAEIGDTQRLIPFPTDRRSKEEKEATKNSTPAGPEDGVLSELKELDLNSLTPLEALLQVNEWKKKLTA